MRDHKAMMSALVIVLALGVSSAAFSQDAYPEPNTPAVKGSAAEEARLGTVPAREDGLGVARDAPGQDMQGTGALDEPISGDGTGPEAQERSERDASDSEPELDNPGLDEPRQPIRPGQMEQDDEGNDADEADE